MSHFIVRQMSLLNDNIVREGKPSMSFPFVNEHHCGANEAMHVWKKSNRLWVSLHVLEGVGGHGRMRK